jgi:hypothetical protein
MNTIHAYAERRIRAKCNMLRKGDTLEDVGVRCVTLDYLRRVRALKRKRLGEFHNTHIKATLAEYDKENPMIGEAVGKACWLALDADFISERMLGRGIKE